MKEFEHKDYKAFELFSKGMPIVTAGTMDHFNGCTVGWGSLGNIWSRSGTISPIVTVYIYPSRYTYDFLTESDTFTVSFLQKEYRKAAGYMGSHSGREGDKAKAAGLTPIAFGDSVTYEEADLVFLCRKLYQHGFSREDLNEEIQAYYQASPGVYPLDENGEWQAHCMFIREVMDVIDKR